MAKQNQKRSVKENLSSLWEMFSTLILDPLLFAFVVYILFERIRSIIEFTSANPQYSFYQAINRDMEMNLLPYIAFFVVLFLWWIAKSIQHRNEVRNNKAILGKLDNISAKLEKLPDEMVEAYKRLKAQDEEEERNKKRKRDSKA